MVLQVKWRSQLLEVEEQRVGEQQPSSSAHWPAQLVCTGAVFAQCGMRTACGHPKEPILLRNNARKSMKGRSDKVERNQRVDPQGLRLI